MAVVKEKPPFDLHPKQKEQRKIIADNMISLSEGGSRSAKTFGILNACFVRACSVPKSMHLVARLRFNAVKRAICYQTWPRLMTARGIPESAIPLNRTDWFYTFSNGSQIWIAGLDEGPRLEKVLGNDYSTIFMDEASEDSYDAFDILLSRLVPSPGLRGKFILAQNPPSRNHWTYQLFHNRKYPDGRSVPENDFGWIKMNPEDNPSLPPEYFKTLDMMSAEKQRRFRLGEYSDDQGTLWKREYFKYTNIAEDLTRVVIGVDPSGTVEGDEIGIIVAATTGKVDKDGLELFTVLDDYSLHGTPREWAAEINRAYNKWNADLIAAEKNFGGDMVEDVILRNHRNMNVKLITSSRSKIVRAEPISALYEAGRVEHFIQPQGPGIPALNPFQLLEDELCQYEPGKSKSPNRLDALVFALSELSGDGPSMLDVL